MANSIELSNIENAVQPSAIVDDNTANLLRHGLQLQPVIVDGVVTTLIGPPTSGTWAVGQVWTDSLRGQFVCTTAGTPGTWVQITPAVRTSDPGTGTIPTGYLIRRTDLDGIVRVHTGSYNWQPLRTVLDAYTVANLPTASSHTNRLVVCTNGDAGARCLAVSDGTNWKRLVLGANVSAT